MRKMPLLIIHFCLLFIDRVLTLVIAALPGCADRTFPSTTGTLIASQDAGFVTYRWQVT